ncbi:NAD(P)-dependent oxidoreductase [Corynebacterium tapiri]|uniref:NAD(P)-dependent oxidoreductase n=1 Tax=Corynebacterium tapiri TaxID=1448266 RepID=A0A5C4U4L5_9CORY|nr:NAD(P)-dependent oxidoreductase [Corynebacterium tapiri]TNL97293.1 NAD(P)-dependent oxidoreductase [Corynebacterium tapiri]
MKIAFLGTGRMGTELALHLINAGHELTVYNRTKDKTARLAEAGAKVADTPEEAVSAAEIVVTSLFGPDTVREVVVTPGLIPAGVTWVDTTTISPDDAREFASAVDTYVHAPVVGTLGPARKGALGVYVGGADEERRQQAAELVKPWAEANVERLVVVDSAAQAATGKLLANLALAVSIQGVKEALYLGAAEGLEAEATLKMLNFTGLEFMKNMKAPFILGERETDPGDFSVNAIAKDVRLMLDTAEESLPATRAALDSLSAQQEAGRGEQDFSSVAVYR